MGYEIEIGKKRDFCGCGNVVIVVHIAVGDTLAHFRKLMIVLYMAKVSVVKTYFRIWQRNGIQRSEENVC